MPMADSMSATAPKSASSTIGVRRPSSDRAIHSSIVRTSAIGCSGSIDATAARTCDDQRARVELRLHDERHARARLLRDRDSRGAPS